MCVQAFPSSKLRLSPAYLLSRVDLVTSPPSTIQLKKMVFDSQLRYAFCNSAKRVSKSLNGLRKRGVMFGVRCESSEKGVHDDRFYIRRCVELAREAVGYTSPNPMVGCVIVRDGKIVGEGFHPKAGQPHAEVFALRNAGDLAENATAYVSLEPCNHYGRTPPCSEALIKAKVKKVVVGMIDPNPIVALKGVAKLRDAGIEVTVGVEEELCKKLNEAFIHQMLTGKPFVTLRYSMSVSGHLLNQLGDGVMESGGYYSKLLQEYDAVVYSSTSLPAKFSCPVSKEPGANQPIQIVLAKCPTSLLQIPAVAGEPTSKVTIFTEKETTVEYESTQKGIETVVLERLNLYSILEHCKRQGLCSVLLDVRGELADFDEILREGFEQHLFQKFVAEVLPIWGGTKEMSLKNMTEQFKMSNLKSNVSGGSVLLEGYF